MADEPIELNGILREDGTVVLDRKPDLPPGPVRVLIAPNDALARTPVWQTLQRIWAEQRAQGRTPRSAEEIDADVAALREGDEERIEAIERLAEECRQARDKESPRSRHDRLPRLERRHLRRRAARDLRLARSDSPRDQAAGDSLMLSDLTRMECLVFPFRNGDAALEASFDSFFSQMGMQIVAITRAVCEEAARIRAHYPFKQMDSLHLAAAVVHGANVFLTNDARLNAFTGLKVEVL